MDSGDSKKAITNGEQRHIPSELIEAILSRLSVKELLRFRCVCKQWKTMIDNYEFKKKLFEVAKGNLVSTLFIWRNSVEPTLHICLPQSRIDDSYQLPLNLGQFLDDSAYNSSDMMILSGDVNSLCFKKFGVVNGLVCVGWNSLHVVYNPCTKEYKRFNAPPRNWVFDLLDNSDICEEVVLNDEICAFGFDPISQDYKFLMAYFTSALTNSQNKMIKVLYQLYSLRNNSWKGVAIDFPLISQVVPGDGYMDDGKFYWFAKKCGDTLGPAVLVFDFSTEVFDWMPLAGDLARGEDAIAVANRGCLEILITFNNGREEEEDLRGEIWGMETDGSWGRKLTVDLPSEVGRPVGLLKEGGMMFEASHLGTGLKELLLLNPATGSFTNLGFLGTQLWVFNYVQSLFSVKL